MLNAMKEFYSGVRSMAIGWQVWLMVLMMANMFVPVFFFPYLEAKLVLAAFFAGGMTGMFLVKLQGFTKLLGLMHIYWIPLIIFLLGRVESAPAEDFFGMWLRILILLNSISLLIDAYDVARYFKERA